MDRVGDLDIDQDLRHEKREWTAHRVGAIGMLLVVIATMGGLFGGGPLSRESVVDPSGVISAEYERFGRSGWTTELAVRVSQVPGDEVGIAFDEDYLAVFQLDQVTPTPDRVEYDAGDLRYVFTVSSAPEEFTARWTLTIDHVGPVQGSVRADGGSVLSLRHFYLP